MYSGKVSPVYGLLDGIFPDSTAGPFPGKVLNPSRVVGTQQADRPIVDLTDGYLYKPFDVTALCVDDLPSLSLCALR